MGQQYKARKEAEALAIEHHKAAEELESPSKGTPEMTDTFDFITRNGNSKTPYSIRVAPLNGEPHFVLFEACRVLDSYVRKDGSVNTNMAASILPTGTVKRLTVEEANRIGVKVRGSRGLFLITEAGLYELIGRSDKPEARAFKDWLYGEVLPTIRKTGGYVLQGADRATVGEGTVAEMPDVGSFKKAIEEMDRSLTALVWQPAPTC